MAIKLIKSLVNLLSHMHLVRVRERLVAWFLSLVLRSLAFADSAIVDGSVFDDAVVDGVIVGADLVGDLFCPVQCDNDQSLGGH